MTLPRLVAALACSLALLLVAAPAARADRVVLVVGGQLKDKERDAIVQIAKTSLAAAGWQPGELDAAATKQALDCLKGKDLDAEGDCVGRRLDEQGYDLGVFVMVSVETQDGAKTRGATALIYTRSGKLVAFEQGFCEGLCASDELEERAREVVPAATSSARAQLWPVSISVRSTPQGAVVSVDGTAVGATDMDYGLDAGDHLIRVEKNGYKPQSKEVKLDDGAHEDLDFTLTPVDGTGDTGPAVHVTKPTTTTPHRSSKLVPWAVLGGGVALVATGAILFALNQDAALDGGWREPRRRDTAALGLGFGAAGAVAASVGAYLLLRHHDDVSDHAKVVTPVVGADAGGATWLGVWGEF